MKKLILPILVLLVISIGSCKKEIDKCVDMFCLYGGTCEDGKCNCPDGFSGDSCEITPICDTGYEGVDCTVQSRSKFLGDFNPTWACTDSVSQYSIIRVHITPESSDITKIRISRIFGAVGAVCTINGQYLSIDQSLSSDTLLTGVGFCEGNNKSVAISFTASSPTTGFLDSCKIVFVRP